MFIDAAPRDVTVRWTRSATLLLILLAAAVTMAADEKRAADDLPALLLRSLDRGLVEPALLQKARQAPSLEVRLQAVQVLASVADAGSLELLESYLGDPAPEVQAAVQVAAGRIGAAADEPVVRGLQSRHLQVRRAAAWAACHTGGRAADLLLQRLGEEGELQVLEIALANLWRLPQGTWETTAAAYTAHPDQALRRAVAGSLARSDGEARLPALRRLAADADASVRLTAVAGFARGSLTTADHRVVLAALDDADWQVQAAACRALAAQTGVTISEPAAVRIAAMLDSPWPHLVVSALAVARTRPEVISSEALRLLIGQGEAWPAAEALAALAARGAETDRKLIATLLATGNETWQRRAAARATALLPGDSTVLEKALLADANAAVRLEWLQALPEKRRQAAAPRLWQVVRTDPDTAVRAQALDLLRQTEPPPAIEQLLELYDAWADEPMIDARATALTAALQQAAGGQRQVVLRRIGSDPDPTLAAMVAVAAGEAAAGLGQRPRVARHPLSWYRELASWARQDHWLDLVTVRGTVRLHLDPQAAPITCRTIFELASSGFYNGLTFHRVVPNFVVQGGDPRGDGWGGAGFTLPDEPSLRPFDRGRVGIATSGANTGGCQLFIMLHPADRLSGHYTAFAEVVAGDEVLERLLLGDRIVRVEVHSGEQPPLPNPVLIGELTWDDLAGLDGWQEEKDRYLPDPVAVEQLQAAFGRYQIISVLATWCDDSRREVPRLVKLLEEIGLPVFSHQLLGVDRSKRAPQLPPGLLPDKRAERVPTILVLDEAGTELGRVVETAEQPPELILLDLVAAAEGW